MLVDTLITALSRSKHTTNMNASIAIKKKIIIIILIDR